jgi:hypothetical protein
MQSVIYIIAIESIGTFLFWTVRKYERNHHAALLLKLAIVGVGFAAIFPIRASAAGSTITAASITRSCVRP